MIYYILGIITGLILALIIFISLKKVDYNYKIEKLVDENIYKYFKREVEFLEPMDEKAEAIAEIIKDNEKEGKDTKYEDL